MKKYRVLREMPGYNVGDIMESGFCHLIITGKEEYSFASAIVDGWVEEVQEGFKEEVDALLYPLMISIPTDLIREQFLDLIDGIHKEERKKWALEIVKEVFKDYWNENDVIKAIEESN